MTACESIGEPALAGLHQLPAKVVVVAAVDGKVMAVVVIVAAVAVAETADTRLDLEKISLLLCFPNDPWLDWLLLRDRLWSLVFHSTGINCPRTFQRRLCWYPNKLLYNGDPLSL